MLNDIIENKQTEKWVKTWQRAGKALEKIKQQELRSCDYDKNRKIIDEMLQWAYDH